MARRKARLRAAVEDAHPFDWERWAGEHGLIAGLDRFDTSASYEAFMTESGLTPEKATERILQRLG